MKLSAIGSFNRLVGQHKANQLVIGSTKGTILVKLEAVTPVRKAKCLECRWTSTNRKSAYRLALNHARQHPDHTVRIRIERTVWLRNFTKNATGDRDAGHSSTT